MPRESRTTDMTLPVAKTGHQLKRTTTGSMTRRDTISIGASSNLYIACTYFTVVSSR